MDTFGGLAPVLEDPSFGPGVNKAETRFIPYHRRQQLKASHSGAPSVVRNRNGSPTPLISEYSRDLSHTVPGTITEVTLSL